MGTNYVPLICYYDGELQHSTGGPNYVGGHIRADRVSKDISFVGFVTKIHELCKLPSGEAIIDIKCRYLIDQQTSIAMDVEDDTSLSVIIDSYPNQCNAIVVYIEKMPTEQSNPTSKRHEEESSSFGDGQVNCMSNRAVEMNENQYSSNNFNYSESLVIDLDRRESMESSTSRRSEDYSPRTHSSPPWQFLPSNNFESTKSCFGMTIYDPRDPFCQKWNKAFLISCMVALALDALFFYAPTIDVKRNCLSSDMRMEIIVCILRSVIDVVHVLQITFRFHTGFYDRTTDKIVVDSWEISKRYLSSFFLIDILAVLPLPQVLVLLILPMMRVSINVSKMNSLRYAVLLQYFPRSLRIYPLDKLLREGNTMIKTAWAGAIFNFSLYMLASHTYLRSDTVKTEIETRKRIQDTEQWMSRYSIPENLKRRITQNEFSMRKRSRGLDDENMPRHIPEDLKRDIKRHLGSGLLKMVPSFDIMDKNVQHAFCDNLKYVFYTDGCIIMRAGEPVQELFFLMRGKLRCTTINERTGRSFQWQMDPGDFCGVELLTWAFSERSKPISIHKIQTVDEVEGFILKAYDLKCLVTEFDLLYNKDVQTQLRFYSREWRIWAVYFIQAAWVKHRKMELKKYLRVSPNDRSYLYELRRLMKRKPIIVPERP